MAPAGIIFIEEHKAIQPRRLEGNPGSWRDHVTIEALVIESWSQGLMVGALLIMACITISNMRAGIFLHKLILLEVGRAQRPLLHQLMSLPALPRHVARDLLLYEFRRLRLVSLFDCSTFILIVDRAQFGGLDEDQTFPHGRGE
jgi:hypothetical protein